MRYLGIKFRRHDEAYQALITIVNETTGLDVVRDLLVDLFADSSRGDYSASGYESWVFWYDLPSDTDVYRAYVSNGGAGDHATYWTANSITPAGTVEYDYFLLSEPFTSGGMAMTARLWHTDYPSDIMTVDLVNGVHTSLLQTTEYNGNNTTDTFAIAGSNRARAFHSWSVDGGVTWYLPDDPLLTWGSDDTHTNKTISEGHFTVVFDDPPANGTANVLIRWYPLCNRVSFSGKIYQPARDGFVDLRYPVRILDFAAEIV